MADASKDYGVADTVFVAYPFPSSLAFVPQQRVVKGIDINSATNESIVTFDDGDKVQDGAIKTVYTTQALAAKAIVDDVIVKVDATVNLDTTTTVGSTAAQTALSLGRVDA